MMLYRPGWLRLLLDAGYVVATLGLGIDVAFDDELCVGVFDGDEADAEVFGEGAFGGELFVGVENATGDVVLDAFVEMRVHALSL